jgi:hypothetical protein
MYWIVKLMMHFIEVDSSEKFIFGPMTSWLGVASGLGPFETKKADFWCPALSKPYARTSRQAIKTRADDIAVLTHSRACGDDAPTDP